MSAALIPSMHVPIARTDADWAFDIDFQDEAWTGSEVKVAFARQGLPAEQFEIDAVSTDGTACAIRIPAATWAGKTPGTWSAEVRKFDGEAIDDAAVFRVLLSRGMSDTTGPAGPPAGDGVAVGGVIVSRVSSAVVVRAGSTAADASLIAFNDALTMLGVDNIQDAIVALHALIGSGPQPDPSGAFDFSIPANSALIGVL